MKHTTLLAAGLAVSATSAFAGGIDRTGLSISPLFEEGSYWELSYGTADPNVSGTAGGGVVSSSDVALSYGSLGAAYKRDLNDKLSFALIFDQPFGAKVDYSDADAGYPLAGSTAEITTNAITAVVNYKVSDRVGVHAGLRAVRSRGEVALNTGYTMNTTTETDFGYLLGASYEIPDIALRAVLTYNSAIDHDFTTTENATGLPADFQNAMRTTLPQSVNLDFQTGIAADTLLMASVRWAEWTAFEISPVGYVLGSGGTALVDYDNDSVSYSLGIGRRFNEKLSGSITAGYEETKGGFAGNLGPTDGYTSLSVGLKYQINDSTALSGGVRYVWIGDAETENPRAPGSTLGTFTDNSAVGFGLKLSHSF